MKYKCFIVCLVTHIHKKVEGKTKWTCVDQYRYFNAAVWLLLNLEFISCFFFHFHHRFGSSSDNFTMRERKSLRKIDKANPEKTTKYGRQEHGRQGKTIRRKNLRRRESVLEWNYVYCFIDEARHFDLRKKRIFRVETATTTTISGGKKPTDLDNEHILLRLLYHFFLFRLELKCFLLLPPLFVHLKTYIISGESIFQRCRGLQYSYPYLISFLVVIISFSILTNIFVLLLLIPFVVGVCSDALACVLFS